MRRGELLPLPLERMREGRRTVLGRISSGSRVSKMGKSGSEQRGAGGPTTICPVIRQKPAVTKYHNALFV
jgi:hypothetical protein